MIKSGAATAKNATIVYNNTNTSKGKLDIKLDTTAGSLDVKQFDLKQGKVIIAGKASALKARTLNVGDGTGNAETSSIEVGTTSVLGDNLSATNADALTNIVVKSDGIITNTKAKGTAETVTVNAATLQIDGGKVVNVDPDSNPDTKNTTLTINLAKGSLTNNGLIDVATNGTVELKFTADAITTSATNATKLAKEFNVDSGGTLDIKGKLVVSGAAAAPATINLKSDSKVKGSGDFIVSGNGTILKADLATVKNVAKGAKLNISGATLDVGSAALDFTSNAQEENKLTLASDAADVSSGKIQFTANSTLKAGSITLDGDLINGTATTASADTITLKNKNGSSVEFNKTTTSANTTLNLDSSDVTISTANGKIILGEDSAKTIKASEAYKKADADKKALLLGHT